MPRLICFIFFLLYSSLTLAAENYKEITWEELIPRSELEIMNKMMDQARNPHGVPIDPNRSLADQMDDLLTQAQDPDFQGLMNSINVRNELDQQNIKIPGFIVPLEANEQHAIIEFFLVPYFGACIHVPPPPPNQIIFVKYPKGLQIQEIWMPFYVYGEIRTEMLDNDMATAAYTMAASEVEEYQGD